MRFIVEMNGHNRHFERLPAGPLGSIGDKQRVAIVPRGIHLQFSVYQFPRIAAWRISRLVGRLSLCSRRTVGAGRRMQEPPKMPVHLMLVGKPHGMSHFSHRGIASAEHFPGPQHALVAHVGHG